MTFENLIKMRNDLNTLCRQQSDELRQFPRQTNGMTPDAVKFSTEYRKIKSGYDHNFAALRKVNQHLNKNYREELKELRNLPT